jgi:hypothetical protein
MVVSPTPAMRQATATGPSSPGAEAERTAPFERAGVGEDGAPGEDGDDHFDERVVGAAASGRGRFGAQVEPLRKQHQRRKGNPEANQAGLRTSHSSQLRPVLRLPVLRRVASTEHGPLYARDPLRQNPVRANKSGRCSRAGFARGSSDARTRLPRTAPGGHLGYDPPGPAARCVLRLRRVGNVRLRSEPRGRHARPDSKQIDLDRPRRSDADDEKGVADVLE